MKVQHLLYIAPHMPLQRGFASQTGPTFSVGCSTNFHLKQKGKFGPPPLPNFLILPPPPSNISVMHFASLGGAFGRPWNQPTNQPTSGISRRISVAVLFRGN